MSNNPSLLRPEHPSLCQRGTVTVLWAIAMPVVLGFIALGIEVSAWYVAQTDLQAATDAAAIATVYSIGGNADLAAVAAGEMARNGFGAGTKLSITVNSPPLSGAYAGDKNAVELIVSLPESLPFGTFMLAKNSAFSLSARAVVLSGSGVVE
jgi:Putative Flp pilus-assembly TadE/G-like